MNSGLLRKLFVSWDREAYDAGLGSVAIPVSEEVTSRRTAFLGKLLGLYCITVSLAMLAHPYVTLQIMRAILQDRPLLFISAVLGVTAGLAIVLSHNEWSGGPLPVMVTLFGWACLIKGALLLLLSPETESRVFITALGYAQHPDLYALFLFLLGASLTYMGFKASETHR